MPLPALLDRTVRPLSLATLAAGVVTALVASGAHAAAPAATAARTAITAPAPTHPPTSGTPRAQPRLAPARVSRAQQRDEWVRPAAGPITSPFGHRWGGFHPGVDIGAAYGAPVKAITTGRIIGAGWIAGYGKVVRVWADGYVFYYPHLSRILRRHGIVRTGQWLGRVGSTGFSTGPHLHIEIRLHNRPINPIPVLRRHGVRL